MYLTKNVRSGVQLKRLATQTQILITSEYERQRLRSVKFIIVPGIDFFCIFSEKYLHRAVYAVSAESSCIGGRRGLKMSA